MSDVRRKVKTDAAVLGAPRRGTGRDTGELSPLESVRAVAHDLRQPAAAISALVAAARLNPDLPESVRYQLDSIALQAREMTRLCRSFVEQSSMRHMRLDHVVCDAVERARLVFATDVAVYATPVAIIGDESAWVRLSGNLLENACRAAGPKGQVCVSLTTAGERVALEVADSGPGFGHGTSGLGGEGLGVVFRAIERHGGHVEIGRGSLGGAVVRVVVPSTEASPTVGDR